MGLDIHAASFWYMCLCASIAGISGIMFGYDSGKDVLRTCKKDRTHGNKASSLLRLRKHLSWIISNRRRRLQARLSRKKIC
jgi:hypothetical protein